MSSATAWALLGLAGWLLANASVVGLALLVCRARRRQEQLCEEARDV